MRPGDSLSSIFQRLGLSDRQLLTLLEADRRLAKRLHRILPGQRIEVLQGPEGELLGLRYYPDPLHVLEARRVGDGYRVQERERPVERRQAFAAGEIRDSLFLSAQRAGLSDRLTMELAGIFGWDIDFLRDIREGDRFAVLYEELYLDGEKLRDGAILAAEFVNRGRRHRAVRYTGPDGRADYYTPEGRSLRRAFLRTPVAFTRISSRFSLGRYHPILHRIRAHRGVDYAAPRGTPVKAAGDGKVAFLGWKGGYGRAVILQHGTRYTTLYGHLARFARGLRRGSLVRQGQVIGYVGSSGLATGPHLHYEFRVDGRHRDPLKVPLPPARPIDPHHRADFLAKTRPLLARLERIAATRLAAAERGP